MSEGSEMALTKQELEAEIDAKDEEIERLKEELVEARVQAYQDRELLQAKLARERATVREQLLRADASPGIPGG